MLVRPHTETIFISLPYQNEISISSAKLQYEYESRWKKTEKCEFMEEGRRSHKVEMQIHIIHKVQLLLRAYPSPHTLLPCINSHKEFSHLSKSNSWHFLFIVTAWMCIAWWKNFLENEEGFVWNFFRVLLKLFLISKNF